MDLCDTCVFRIDYVKVVNILIELDWTMHKNRVMSNS